MEKKTTTQKQERILSWATFGNFNDVVKKLNDIALYERWYYTDYEKSSNHYPILKQYLIHTFEKLEKENKIIYEDEYAAFNTGLVDNLYEPIYAMFERKKTIIKQEWSFKDFCTAGQGFYGRKLISEFTEMPRRAQYFFDPWKLIIDEYRDVKLNWKHIIIENINRLPVELFRKNTPKDFVLRDVSKMSKDEKVKYYEELSESIQKDEECLRNIKSQIEQATEVAMKKSVWNYKTAVPMYYPELDSMSLLLPLSIISEKKVDVALVVEKQKNGNYIGHTILTLKMAYNDARLIARPESAWLIL